MKIESIFDSFAFVYEPRRWLSLKVLPVRFGRFFFLLTNIY
nr:MAG TPA: hypothetical protein [Caudoviricetes sp.]